jgi:hypothetical protein
VRRDIGHAPAAAGGAEAAPLTREGGESVELARVAVEPEEAVGEDSACEVRAERLLDEAGHRMVAFSGPREEALELLAHDAV